MRRPAPRAFVLRADFAATAQGDARTKARYRTHSITRQLIPVRCGRYHHRGAEVANYASARL